MCYILSDYCIGSIGKVNTVVLFSNCPLDRIKEISLDTDSRTSVQLVKILAEKHWKISPFWKPIHFNGSEILPESTVAIGDKTFELKGKYKYVYDLGEEWFVFSKLPFVFACWVSVKKIEDEIIHKLNQSLAFGVTNKLKAVVEHKDVYKTNVVEYVEKYISYELDENKRKGMVLFLNYLKN